MSEALTAGFIGGGNMAASLIGGLINGGWDPRRLVVSDPDASKTANLRQHWGLKIADGNEELVRGADVVILAVKPQVMRDVLKPLAGLLPEPPPLMLSVAAGVRIDSIEGWLDRTLPVVRVMPNTPALVGAGVSGLCANERVDDRGKRIAQSMLEAVGITGWVDTESQLDAITALSGSGPAYFMLFMECLEKAAVDLGLNRQLANRATIQTCLGAAKLAASSGESLEQLRINVTSPGGTTERALAEMFAGGIELTIRKAMVAAADRAGELAEQLAGEQ